MPEKSIGQPNLNKKIKIGLKWNLINQVISQFIFIWFSIYLARLLGPQAYGLVGMVTVLSGFAVIFVDFGFTSSIIYYQIEAEKKLSSIFWFNIFAASIIYLIFFILAPTIAKFYNEPQLVKLTRVICFGIIISAFSSMQATLLSKEINFKKKVIIQWFSTIVSYSVGFFLAFKGYGVWSIVFMSLVNNFVNSVILWLTSSWKPSFYFSLEELKGLTKYSTNIGATSIFTYLTRNLDNFIVAKFLGQTDLGLYTNAYRLMMLPVTNVAGIFGSVLFSGFSKLGDDLNKMADIYLKTVKVISFVTFPLMIGIFSISQDLIMIMYGHKWMGAVPLIRILSLLGAVQSILFLNGTIFNAVGKPKVALYTTIVLYLFLIVGWIIGLKLDGIIGFTRAYLIIAGLGSVFILYNAIRFINLNLFNVFQVIKKQLFGSLLMGCLIYILNRFFLIQDINIRFTVNILLGISFYVSYSFLFQRDMISIIKGLKSKSG